MDPAEPEKVVTEKAHKINDSAILSEIDRTMKKFTDSVLHAIDGVSARLSQLESRTSRLEYAMDDLKVCIGNNHGSADGKMRHLENILLEVLGFSACFDFLCSCCFLPASLSFFSPFLCFLCVCVFWGWGDCYNLMDMIGASFTLAEICF